MPSTEWPRGPAFTSFDVWLHEALVVGIADNVQRDRDRIEAEEQAEALERERIAKATALSIRNRLAAQHLRTRKFRASRRPWQSAGFSRKSEWESAGRPDSQTWSEEEE